MKDKWFYVKLLSVMLGGSIVFWGLAICSFKFFSFGIIDPQGIVLVFVGILATFVVVSNYAQVLTIKQDFESKITEIEQNSEKKIKASNQEYNDRIQKLEDSLNKKLIETEKRLKDKLVLSNRIDALMPKFNAYRQLINVIFTIVDLWKNKEEIKRYNFYKSEKNNVEVDKISQTEGNNFLSLYRAYKFISDGYERDAMSESLHRIPKISEIDQYKTSANWIWFTNDRMGNVIDSQLNLSSFTNLDGFAKERIQESLANFDDKYSTKYSMEELSFDLIANISGNVEIEVLDALVDLITQYN